MKKIIISMGVFLFILAILVFYIDSAFVKEKNYLTTCNSMNKIMLLNKDFNLYLTNTLSYDNFDIIHQKIVSFNEKFNNIKNHTIIKHIKNKDITILVKQISDNINEKFEMIDRVKSYRAILNNSFRLIQKIEAQGVSKNISKLYSIIMTIDKNPDLNPKEELANIEKLKLFSHNKFDKYFIKHAKTILIYQQKMLSTKEYLNTLEVDRQLDELTILYIKELNQSILKAKTSIVILFILLIISIAMYMIYEYKLNVSYKSLSRFKKTVEHSDNIVLITDKNENIKYVNDAFTKTTGYLPYEVIGKKPDILKSGNMPKEFYENLNRTIYSGKKWSGVFINKSKTGELSYEKASITPVLDDNGNIEEFIAIKLDITNETIIEQKLKKHSKNQENILKKEIDKALSENTKQLQILQQQTKMAQMGEMIGAIAHQWRQPLNAISTSIQNLQFDYEDGFLKDEKYVKEFIDKNKKTIIFMSSTIDDFRNFFRVDKEMVKFNVAIATKVVVQMLEAELKDKNIKITMDVDEFIYLGLYSEYQQVILNIINNAKDALIDNNITEPKITIVLRDRKVYIEDNAGGISNNILDRIFEPYFTTKEQGKGTGMGLYLSKMIIEDNMGASLSVENKDNGALFTIDLSKDK